jgi:hypothetical protein
MMSFILMACQSMTGTNGARIGAGVMNICAGTFGFWAALSGYVASTCRGRVVELETNGPQLLDSRRHVRLHPRAPYRPVQARLNAARDRSKTMINSSSGCRTTEHVRRSSTYYPRLMGVMHFVMLVLPLCLSVSDLPSHPMTFTYRPAGRSRRSLLACASVELESRATLNK